MKIYEYAVHNRHNYGNFIFIKASDSKHAIKRAFKEYFEKQYYNTLTKKDLRATRVTK